MAELLAKSFENEDHRKLPSLHFRLVEKHRFFEFDGFWIWASDFPMAEEKASAYRRAPETRGAVASYEQKFAGLIRLCESARTDGIRNIVVTWPWVIGDNYEELIESLSRIADAGLVLHIVKGAGKADSPNVTLN